MLREIFEYSKGAFLLVDIIQVVLERWGSLDILAEYGAPRRAAAPRAHLHAIRNRKQGQDDEKPKVANNDEKPKVADNDSERDYKKVLAMTPNWVSWSV